MSLPKKITPKMQRYAARARALRWRLSDAGLAATFHCSPLKVTWWIDACRSNPDYRGDMGFAPWQLSRIRRAVVIRPALHVKAIARRLRVSQGLIEHELRCFRRSTTTTAQENRP